jgi:hypothetical protein
MDVQHDYEPPKKKMKYEEDTILLLQFEIGYLTKKGNILLENKKILDNDDNDDNVILQDRHNRPFEMYILNFQTFEGGELYLISDKSQIDINKGYTIKYIFENFINGHYLIGTLQAYYKNNYNYTNGIIDNISTYNSDNNSEIILHYTKTKDYDGNVAWRTIHWDLFEEFVPT